MTGLNHLDDIRDKRMIKSNESCFLSNNEKVYYDSIIILEMFYIEDFCFLFDGLDLLYSNLNGYDKSRLIYRDILNNDKKSSFRGILNLPFIVNTKLKDQFLPGTAFQDLSDDFESISITLQATLPSMLTLQIQVSLDSNISNKINDVIYTYHEEVNEKHNDYGFTTKHPPSYVKNKEITQIRHNLKEQIINFLSEYFEGFFFKQAKKHISYVPSIDLLSLNYSEKSEDISDWLFNNNSFLNCFNISAPWLEAYKYENYLFFPPFNHNKEAFSNYVIIANRKTADKEGYTTIKSSIQYKLNTCLFEILCYKRWVEIEEKTGLSLNSLVSKELEYITKNDFNKVISNREVVTKYMFYFERFKIEFSNYTFDFSKDDLPFESLNEKDVFLFNQLVKRINEYVIYIDKFISTLNRHSDNTLALKNIQFNKKMQERVNILTIIVILLTILQIYVTLYK
jgi:hypothetical protein